MPTKKKSSPTKAKSPKSRSKSRSRSTSKARKTASRSRSRSSRRRSASDVEKTEPRAKSPGRPPKRTVLAATKDTEASPAKPAVASTSTVVQREEVVTPTRVSRRILEKTTYQASLAQQAEKLSALVLPSAGDVQPMHEAFKNDANNNAALSTVEKLKADSDGVRRTSKGDQTDDTKAKPASVVKEQTAEGLGYYAILFVLFMLMISYYVALSCNKKSCALLKWPSCPASWKAFFNAEVFLLLICFHGAIALLAFVPVGAIVQGQPLSDGQRLDYRCNGWFSMLVAAAVFGYAVQSGQPVKMSFVNDHFVQFVAADVVLAFSLGLIFLATSRFAPANQRNPAADGTFWNDFCMGRVLHPRIGLLDAKQNLVRASLIGMTAIDWMYLMDRFKTTQSFDPALTLVVVGHTLYNMFTIKDEFFWFSSNDFVKEGGGFYFTWASLTYIPYIGTLQTRFLYLHPEQGLTNKYVLAAIFVFNILGLVIFVGANWQKSQFRRNPYNPELSHLVSIPTATGKRLLCSGWWGIVRRPNYLGDLMQALACSLPCGFSYGMPYAYFTYLFILLVARVISDERSCHQRYGEAWVKYTETVRYRLVPCVF